MTLSRKSKFLLSGWDFKINQVCRGVLNVSMKETFDKVRETQGDKHERVFHLTSELKLDPTNEKMGEKQLSCPLS